MRQFTTTSLAKDHLVKLSYWCFPEIVFFNCMFNHFIKLPQSLFLIQVLIKTRYSKQNYFRYFRIKGILHESTMSITENERKIKLFSKLFNWSLELSQKLYSFTCKFNHFIKLGQGPVLKQVLIKQNFINKSISKYFNSISESI